jgi:hypothetical protein
MLQKLPMSACFAVGTGFLLCCTTTITGQAAAFPPSLHLLTCSRNCAGASTVRMPRWSLSPNSACFFGRHWLSGFAPCKTSICNSAPTAPADLFNNCHACVLGYQSLVLCFVSMMKIVFLPPRLHLHASTDLLQELCWRQHSADPEVVPAQPEGSLHKRIIRLGLQLHRHSRCSRYGKNSIMHTPGVAFCAHQAQH